MPELPTPSGSQFLERKLATILSADVAEFSRLMGEDEEQTLRIFRGHKQVFESLVAMHRGRIFNTAGDAILAEFGSAVEAVRCATDIQAALRTRNDQLPLTRQVRFRIGINLGDVMVQGLDLLGDGVNVAARLQTAAEPGGVCLSGSVYDQVRNKLSLSFQSLGEKNFKNIQQPVRTFSITEAEGGGILPAPKPNGSKSNSLKWILAGLLPVLLAAGAYWAYSVHDRSKAGSPQWNAPAAQPQVAPREPAKPNLEQPAATQPQALPNSAPPAPASTIRVAAAPHQSAPHARPQSSAPAEAAPSPKLVGPFDGAYSGQICYGKTPMEPSRCFHAEGVVSAGKITAKWPVGKEGAITMLLTGDVTDSGDVKIEMHSEKPDGTILSVIDLKGTLHDGLMNATGAFRRGRTATLNWHKNPAASR